jgi:hypothetical protein
MKIYQVFKRKNEHRKGMWATKDIQRAFSQGISLGVLGIYSKSPIMLESELINKQDSVIYTSFSCTTRLA